MSPSAAVPAEARSRRGGRYRHLVWRAVQTSVAVVVVLILGVVAMMGVAKVRAHDGVTVILNHPVLTVLSGSMRPTFAPGDVIIDGPVNAGEVSRLHVGEIITFREPGSTLSPAPLVTHRIVAVDTSSQHASASPDAARSATAAASVAYKTRGDDNNVADPWTVTPNDVVGIYQHHIPKAGYLLQDLRSRWAIVAALVLAFIWVGEEQFRKRWQTAGHPPASAGNEKADRRIDTPGGADDAND